jgi:hypothetical protein
MLATFLGVLPILTPPLCAVWEFFRDYKLKPNVQARIICKFAQKSRFLSSLRRSDNRAHIPEQKDFLLISNIFEEDIEGELQTQEVKPVTSVWFHDARASQEVKWVWWDEKPLILVGVDLVCSGLPVNPEATENIRNVCHRGEQASGAATNWLGVALRLSLSSLPSKGQCVGWEVWAAGTLEEAMWILILSVARVWGISKVGNLQVSFLWLS